MATKNLPYNTYHYPLNARFYVRPWHRVVKMEEFKHLWHNGIYTSAKTIKQALNAIRYKMSWQLFIPLVDIELFPDDLVLCEKDLTL